MYRIFVINPGSTSTKLAYFEDEKKLHEANIFHDAPLLAGFGSVNNQLAFRKQMILDFLSENDIDLNGIDAIVGRGGSSVSVKSGTYEVNDRLIRDVTENVAGVEHPANLGVPLAVELAKEYGGRVFMVDSPKTDEFIDEARITGIDGLYRVSSLHVLNLKGTARLHCKTHGMRYEESRLIVCHIDGGMSVSAHDHGRMIDGTNNAWGEGPFTPTRTGALPVHLAVNYFTGEAVDSPSGRLCRESDAALPGKAASSDASSSEALSTEEISGCPASARPTVGDACTRAGGFVSHFGTSNSDKVHEMVCSGDPKAIRVWNAMLYNICKSIGSMAAALGGGADAIVCGGGLLRFDDLCEYIEKRCGWIAPVYFYPGEVEHEAMAAGALRVLRGEEEPQIYTGIPVWSGFAD